MYPLILAFILLLSGPVSSWAMDLGQVRNEQVSSLVINGGEGQVYSYCDRLPVGQIVSISIQAEVTNPQNFNVGLGSCIRAYDYACDQNGCTYIQSPFSSPPVMSNVTPSMHHMVIVKAYSDRVAYAGAGNTRCYTLVLWAAAEAGGGYITVDQGYGFLQVVTY
jgi:hypothetical protein